MPTRDTPVTAESADALPGVGRALVAAGKLEQQFAQEIYQKALTSRSSFVAELTGSGAVSASDLAHTLAQAFALPLIDLDAVDTARLPTDLLDRKICQDFRVMVLGKRLNRIIVATADPAEQQAAEKIKFATGLSVDWIVAEYDKLIKLVSRNAATAAESIENIVGDSFAFDDLITEPVNESANAASEVDDAPVVRFLQKMLVDAFSMRASDLHFEPYEHSYRVRFRIDGELREMAAPPVAIKDKLASRIKVISKMDISEKRLPARRPHETQDRTRPGDRLSGQHPAHAVWRKNRDPDSGSQQCADWASMHSATNPLRKRLYSGPSHAPTA
jgi:type IV pilus assembly protein PilB